MSRTVWGESALMIISAVLLAGLFWLLFRGDSETDLREGTDALAVSCYLCAHGSLLSYLTEAFYRLSSHFSKALLSTGFSVVELSDLVFLFLTLIYVAIATGICFGPSWKSGLKGIVAVVWALAELISITGAAIATYVLLANIMTPEEYSRPWDGGVSPEAFLIIGVASLILLFPLFAHLGAELYYRWR
jgi:hypothetical protein